MATVSKISKLCATFCGNFFVAVQFRPQKAMILGEIGEKSEQI